MNNLAQVDRIPDMQVRELLNLDPVGGGALQRRAGFSKVVALANVHGAIPYLDGLLVAAGDQLVRYIAATNEHRLIGTIAATGGLCGAELNGDAFMCSRIGSARIRGDLVGAWGLPEIVPRVALSAGRLPAGIYRVAVTALDAFGAESGAAPLIITLDQPGSISLLWIPPAGAVECRVYASVANGETLYQQTKTGDGGFTLQSIDDSGARLLTGNLSSPPVATQIAAYKGRLVLVCGSALWITEPFAPHLVNKAYGFVQYGAPVDMVAVTDGGIYVAAGQKTYFLSAPGTADISQRAVLEVGAVPGSGVTLPSGLATWMTRYGQAMGDIGGSVQLPQRDRHAPILASEASAGLVEANGLQMLVTTMRGATGPNSLGVEDSFDMEIE
ncbi:hypothetical protein N5C80_26560 [Pseudomonas nicosulfuronedens]|uniref:hypothetical protein n=1 Tax=Pseudomonas nicosulfuronedens TaxID=2571105 RepID=UPI00244B9754|nr:hypothetical protein [Pseudomonas nicosulfuronedens]MDH1012310.1 hypothetical protein [Pseudomonas nicosulfuronedens]MDH2030479.1 hypothetical protein [Pseudomonas nicosulfuronedens]